MNRYIRALFSLTTLSLIVLYGSSLQPSLKLWSEFLVLGLIYLAILWSPGSWWTRTRHTVAAILIIALVFILYLSNHSRIFPESLLLIPLVLLLAREQERDQRYFIALAILTLITMCILAPSTMFIVDVLPTVIALYMSVRAINIYKAAYHTSLRNIEELNIAHQELQKTHAALQEETIHSIRYTALAERTRLARDIHDGLGHHLTSLIVQLQALEIMLPGDPAQAARMIPNMLDGARKAMAEVHQVVKTWHEEESSDGLVALQGLVRQCATHAPFTVSFKYDDDLSSWPVEVSVALYRILQEALTNALRHANASAVHIQLQEQSDRVLLTIFDNGCYTDTRPLIPGYGIRGMMERCQSLGGTCHIALNPPHGLNILVTLPLTPAPVDISSGSMQRRYEHG